LWLKQEGGKYVYNKYNIFLMHLYAFVCVITVMNQLNAWSCVI